LYAVAKVAQVRTFPELAGEVGLYHADRFTRFSHGMPGRAIKKDADDVRFNAEPALADFITD
jgi:hypothetical protein